MQLAFDFGVEQRDPVAGARSPHGKRNSGPARGGEFPRRGVEFRPYYFFAILPDEATAAQIGVIAADLQERFQLQGRLIAAARYHVSLHGLDLSDRTEADLVAAMEQAADTVSAASVALCFDAAMSFRHRDARRPLVLSARDRIPALDALHDTLRCAMIDARLRAHRSFTPHLTLHYDARLVPVTAVPRIRWTARDFVLIRSWQGLSRYDLLGRWPLRRGT